MGLIVQKNKTEWADFHSPDISDSRYDIDLKLIPENDTNLYGLLQSMLILSGYNMCDILQITLKLLNSKKYINRYISIVLLT